MSITQIDGNSIAESGGATSLVVTYSPIAGNCAIVIFNTGQSYSGLTVQDNLGNFLTAGPTVNLVASFYQFPVPSGVTSYTASWTTARQASLAVEEYSGVAAVNASLVGNTNTGSGSGAITATITVTTEFNNAWVVCGLGDSNAGGAFTLTGSVGNQRQRTTTSNGRIILMDNTSALPGSVTCSATSTFSSTTTWSALAIELQPNAAGGNEELTLLGCGL